MENKMYVALLCFIVLASGCVEQKTPAANEGSTQPEKWSYYSSQNKPFECDVKITQDGDSFAMKVFLLGKDLREEMVFEGQQVKMIFSNGKTFVANVAPDESEYGLEDCNWIQLPESSAETPSQQLYNIELFESMGKASFTCKPASFGQEKFVPEGKTCDMSQFGNTG